MIPYILHGMRTNKSPNRGCNIGHWGEEIMGARKIDGGSNNFCVGYIMTPSVARLYGVGW
jgi:hypothetical protein